MEQTTNTSSSGFVATVAVVCCAVFVVIAQLASPSSSATPEPSLSAIELRALATQSTLRVSANTCGRVTRGSGVILDGRLVTNAHVVTGATELKADQPIDPMVLPLSDIDLGSDLASSEQPPGVSLQLAADDGLLDADAVGRDVLLAGHADGGGVEIISGSVSARVSGGPYGYTTDVLLIDAETRGGYSGGPVLDGAGRVVAILSGFDRSTGLTLAVPADVVRDFLGRPQPGADATVLDCSTQ